MTTSNVVEFRRRARRMTPPEFVLRALEAGGDDPEDGFRILLAELPKEEVPAEIAAAWQQARIIEAGLSVMCNGMLAVLEEVDPEVVKLLE